jgi:hypothetical protein
MMTQQPPVIDPIDAAREVARAEVRQRWPELAGVEPTVALRERHVPSHADAGPLGSAVAAAPAAHPRGEYIFTFAGHVHTPDGYLLPRVARVTVDAQRRVVKATTSK